MNLSAKSAAMIEKAKSVGWDLGLSSIKALLYELDNPQDKVKAIHVTGTNGKGSTCAFINSILIEAGYRVGRYTSPAVECEFERYTINDKWIDEETYIKLLDVIAYACDNLQGVRHPSLFEIETVMAYLYFSECNCDVMIIEVGMGGILDATNVISSPLICVFTNIGLEHTKWLGDSLAEVAKNKAGIIKDNTFVVSAIQEDSVKKILLDTSKSHMAEINFAAPLNSNYKLGLEGEFQYQNAAIARECAYYLRLNNFDISEDDINNGLIKTRWPFRFEKIYDTPQVYLDGAHNLQAIMALKNVLYSKFSNKKLTFVVSVLADKSFDEMFEEIIPLCSNVILIESKSERALDKESMELSIRKYIDKDRIFVANDCNQAVQKAIGLNNDLIICFGTFTYLSELKDSFKEILKND